MSTAADLQRWVRLLVTGRVLSKPMTTAMFTPTVGDEGYGWHIADRPRVTEGRMKLWPGMLYGSLKRMAEAGLVAETDAPAGAPRDQMERRFYRITPEGRRALHVEATLLASYLETARVRNRT